MNCPQERAIDILLRQRLLEVSRACGFSRFQLHKLLFVCGRGHPKGVKDLESYIANLEKINSSMLLRLFTLGYFTPNQFLKPVCVTLDWLQERPERMADKKNVYLGVEKS
jgi:hypothetical protein